MACNTSTAVALGDLPPALRPAGPRRDPARRLGGGPRDAQPAGRRHRHAGHDPLARLLQRDQGREPGGRGLRARDASLVPMVEAGELAGPDAEASGGRGASRRCSASATPTASSSSRGRPARDRHAAARLHALPAAAAAHRGASPATASRSSTRRRRPRRRWPSCWRSTASRRPAGAPTAGARTRPPGPAGVHRQLTTGDVGPLRARSPAACSGRTFPDVSAVELGVRA